MTDFRGSYCSKETNFHTNKTQMVWNTMQANSEVKSNLNKPIIYG